MLETSDSMIVSTIEQTLKCPTPPFTHTKTLFYGTTSVDILCINAPPKYVTKIESVCYKNNLFYIKRKNNQD